MWGHCVRSSLISIYIEINDEHTCSCVCMHFNICVCVGACACVCMGMCGSVRVSMCACASVSLCIICTNVPMHVYVS